MRRWLALFRHEGRIDGPLVGVFAGINLLVALNAALHSPFVGYDAADHLIYIEVLAEGRFPTPEESSEFFAAPLPYVGPAWLRAAIPDRPGIVAKAAQLQNVAWSLGLTLALVACGRLLWPGNRRVALWSLALLGTLPVYYKTFAFVRGEPLVAFLAVVTALAGLRLKATEGAGWGRWLGLGVLVGLLMLSKQWAAFVVLALLVFLAWCAHADPHRRRRYLAGAAAALTVSVAASGWYYAMLHARYGSAAAFNKAPSAEWSLQHRPPGAFTSLGWPALFTDPVREVFSPGETAPLLLPVFFSEVWGDYWGYWVVRGRDWATGAWVSGEPLSDLARRDPRATNRETMAPYLGRVNAAALLPTAVLALGLIVGTSAAWRAWRDGREASLENAGLGLAAAIVVISFGGYLLLLVRYPDLDVKASYLLHTAPFAALLGAAALDRLARRSPAAYRAVAVLLLAVALHNAPLFVTRYVWW